MKKPKIIDFKSLDLPRLICTHLIGDNHSKSHRYVTGFMVMAIGVGITKIVLLVELGVFHFIGDLIGYGIHGVGAVPFVDSVINKHNDG